MKIRILAMLLALLMLSALAVGCADNGDKPANDTTTASPDGGEVTNAPDGGDVGDGGDVTTAEPVPEFVEADYGNDDFIIFQRNSQAASYPGFYIDSDEPTDTMSEATYLRNLAVEEKYKIVISSMEVADPYKEIRTYVSSGDVPFDLVLDRRSYMGALAQEGYFYDFNQIEHIDFTQPWWDANCARDYEVAGKLFFMVNDVSVSNLAGARFFYFNRNLINEFSLEDPYKLIENNQWTLDKFLELVRSVSVDNGDNVWDGNDVYGLCTETGDGNGNIMHLLVGCGIKFIEKDTTGELITKAYSEKTQTVMTRVAETLLGTNYVLSYGDAAKGADTSDYANNYDYGRSLFANDHFLFIQGNMAVSSQFRDMTSDYGVAPNPKFDSAQEEYYHKMDKYSLLWAIPKCEMDYDRLGVVLEYWAYESSKTVMPAYYEITIKTKRVPDETASRMIDLVKDSIRYDTSEIYNGEVLTILYNGYTTGNLASTWKGGERVIQKKLDNIYKTLSELE